MSEQHSLEVVRIRHPLKFRLLEVARVETVTPHLRRVTLRGDDLHDFESASFDDHVKVFFPADGETHPAMPVAGSNGPEFPSDRPRPIARDFTPRRYDRAARELDLEFTLHADAGSASAWAAQARAGQCLGIGGPRGSFVIPTGFDWHLLIGDETALPAIARRLEELPAETRVAAVLDVAAPSSRVRFTTRAEVYETWCYRKEAAAGAADSLLEAVSNLHLPSGDGYVWAAGEASAMRALRQHLTAERGLPKHRIRAAGYWRRGTAAVHESIDD